MAPRPDSPGRPSLLWIAPLTDHSGYADEARGFLRALEREGRRPAARERRWRDSDAGLTASDGEMLRSQLGRTPRDPVVVVHHYIPAGRLQIIDGAVNVARTMFETDSVPAAWVPALLERDEIWVPSRHNVESFRSAGIPESKLRVLGATIDFDLFAPGADPLPLGAGDDELVFLTNFDFSERKGWRTLLQAWARAFDRHDPVRLVLKADSFDRGGRHVEERVDAFLREARSGGIEQAAPITVLTDTLAPGDLPRLYAGADAYVMPSHGEGWGRPYMEAMAMGLPTIASRWSGNLEFMDDATSWLVDGDLAPVPLDTDPYFGTANGHNWFAPDVDAVVAALRDVAADPAAARARAAGARPDLLERFGPHRVAADIVAASEAALERHGPQRTSTFVIRGSFGSTASLALINDRLGDELTERGWRVRHRGLAGGSMGEDAVGFTHGWPPSFEPVTDGPTVACLPWEFGSPPVEWVERVAADVDRVWVPSAYVRDGYVAGGMPPGVVEVVPNGVDTDSFSPDGPVFELPRRAGCVFLFVGGTIGRKGIDLLLRAWDEAFTADDDVLLVIKDAGTASHYKGQNLQAALRARAERSDLAPLVYLDTELAPAELPLLYRAADVLAVPYRGEGFCLPALEAMACGRPVIHNGAGPTAEFVGQDAGWALPARRVQSDGEGLMALTGPAVFHEVDHDALVRALREAAAEPETRLQRGRAGRRIALGYTWSHVAAAAERSLQTLEDEALPLAREIVPATVDGHDEVVLFAPDWSRDESWAEPLLRWTEHLSSEHPVTLALYIGEADTDAVIERVLALLGSRGRAEETLSDLAVCDPSGSGLAGLVARAQAVLVGDDDGDHPQLTRRARRVLRAREDELAPYAASLRARTAALAPARG